LGYKALNKQGKQMTAYPLTALITLIAIGVYFYMGLRVGLGRGKYKIEAPATSGHPEFDRLFRVHMNTLEGMVMFIPALWIFAVFRSDIGAAILGLIWVIGRIVFMLGYTKAATSRSAGFGIQFIALIILVLGSVFSVIASLF
jgi:glutathione S-transferase